MLEPVRLCEMRLPASAAMVAVMRAVVVLPLLPVMTIFVAFLGPTTDLRTLGSMRRAIKPGKLVPPPIRKRRPDAPANFPAEMASARRALPSPVGAELALLLVELALLSLVLVGISSVCMKTSLLSTLGLVPQQYNKHVYGEQVGVRHFWCGTVHKSNLRKSEKTHGTIHSFVANAANQRCRSVKRLSIAVCISRTTKPACSSKFHSSGPR